MLKISGTIRGGLMPDGSASQYGPFPEYLEENVRRLEKLGCPRRFLVDAADAICSMSQKKYAEVLSFLRQTGSGLDFGDPRSKSRSRLKKIDDAAIEIEKFGKSAVG